MVLGAFLYGSQNFTYHMKWIEGKVIEVNNETFIISELVNYGGYEGEKQHTVKWENHYPEEGRVDKFKVYRESGSSELYNYNPSPGLAGFEIIISMTCLIFGVLITFIGLATTMDDEPIG